MKYSKLFKSIHFSGSMFQKIAGGFLMGVLSIVCFRSAARTGLGNAGSNTSKTQSIHLNHCSFNEADTLHFKMLALSDSASAFDGELHAPIGKINMSFPMATDKSDKADYLNKEIKKMIGVISGKTAGEFEEVAKTEMQQYLQEYKKDMAYMLKSSPEMKDSAGNYGTSMNYISDNEIAVVENAHDYVIIQEDNYDYSGGAHGNYGSFFTCFDVAQQQKIGLKDVLSIDSVTMQPIVEEYFRKQYKLKADEGLNTILFDDYLPANNNFYFNDKGITFIYNPYEVAAYAVGKIEVFIPYEAVKSYLNTGFAKRIGVALQ